MYPFFPLLPLSAWANKQRLPQTDTLYRYSSSYRRESSNRNISGVVDAALTPSVLLSSIASRESHPKVVIDNSRSRVPEEDSEELVKRLKEMEQSYVAES